MLAPFLFQWHCSSGTDPGTVSFHRSTRVRQGARKQQLTFHVIPPFARRLLTSPWCSTGGGKSPSSISLPRIISRISSAVMSPRNKSAFGSATASFMALMRGCLKLTISRAIRAAFCSALSTIRKSQ